MYHHQKTIWVVDEAEEIIFSFMFALANMSDYRFVYVHGTNSVQAEPGDIIFMDLTENNSHDLKLKDGVHVVRMTDGDQPAELHKPFSGREVRNLVLKMEKRKILKRTA